MWCLVNRSEKWRRKSFSKWNWVKEKRRMESKKKKREVKKNERQQKQQLTTKVSFPRNTIGCCCGCWAFDSIIVENYDEARKKKPNIKNAYRKNATEKIVITTQTKRRWKESASQTKAGDRQHSTCCFLLHTENWLLSIGSRASLQFEVECSATRTHLTILSEHCNTKENSLHLYVSVSLSFNFVAKQFFTHSFSFDPPFSRTS